MLRIVILFVVGMGMGLLLLFVSCNSGEDPGASPDGTATPGADNTTPTIGVVTRTPTPGPTSIPTFQSMEEARNLGWSHLHQCFSLDPGDLVAYRVRDDWFVKAATGDLSPGYGLWKVAPRPQATLKPRTPWPAVWSLT